MDPSDYSLVLCKIKLYFSGVGSILPPSFVVLACIDRLISSSPNINFRSWSQSRFAYRLVAVTSIFWMLFYIHAFFGSTVYSGVSYSFCYIQEGSYALFVTIYLIIVNYLLPPVLMTVLGLLTIINVRQAQRRVHPNINRGYGQRKDRHLLRMLLFQVLFNVIFTIPIAVYQVAIVSRLPCEDVKLFFFCIDTPSGDSPLAERSCLESLGVTYTLRVFAIILYSQLCWFLYVHSDSEYIQRRTQTNCHPVLSSVLFTETNMSHDFKSDCYQNTEVLMVV